jgi:hypothetical protein
MAFASWDTDAVRLEDLLDILAGTEHPHLHRRILPAHILPVLGTPAEHCLHLLEAQLPDRVLAAGDDDDLIGPDLVGMCAHQSRIAELQGQVSLGQVHRADGAGGGIDQVVPGAVIHVRQPGLGGGRELYLERHRRRRRGGAPTGAEEEQGEQKGRDGFIHLVVEEIASGFALAMT